MSHLADELCGPEPHLHDMAGILFFRGVAVVMDSRISILVPDGTAPLADRIVELLTRHGICDVPDTVSELAPWPPPNPAERIASHIFPDHNRGA